MKEGDKIWKGRGGQGLSRFPQLRLASSRCLHGEGESETALGFPEQPRLVTGLRDEFPSPLLSFCLGWERRGL